MDSISRLTWLTRNRLALALLGALVVPPALCALLSTFRHSLVNPAAAVFLVALIVVIATTGNRLSGVLASLSTALWFDYFLTPDYEHFVITRRADVETTIALLVVGVLVTEVAARSHHHRRVSTTEATYIAAFGGLAGAAAGTTAIATALAETSANLTELLSLRSCRVELGVVEPPLARITADGEVTHVGLRWPVESIGIPGPEAEIAIVWRGRVRGRFVLVPTPGLPVSRERRVVAVSLATLAGALLAESRVER